MRKGPEVGRSTASLRFLRMDSIPRVEDLGEGVVEPVEAGDRKSQTRLTRVSS